ncbi:PEP-CTERM sorting domain-containing protein [Gloeothece verrucosa]|uniref:PEP-CTERM protein-sorting domain-containing protein n=1 Tax=Gloeothece verrucosa (strain PCC 7822) TaxID=497965 RepID=E0UEK6_GLOV7|nr:PEP-CTERM sorting domain-containing protein [Gloeothece verrucosa]ADN16574.1 hypothetical protein Cyan7822_4668 [Gloeothece verrucosa PCC 7822]
MIPSWLKWTTLTACTIIPINMIALQPVQAASFKFNFVSYEDPLFSYGSGELSFDDSSLQGFGKETVNITELKNVNFNYFLTSKGYLGDVLYYGRWITSDLDLAYNSDIDLEFNNGELSGLFFNEYQNYTRGGYGGSIIYEINIDYKLAFEGKTFLESYSGTEYSAGYDYNNDEFFEYTNDISATGAYGTITFETIVPVEPVPEPLTILGTGTAIGFSLLFKKMKQKN